MNQAFALNDGAGQPEIECVVVVKMRKGLAAVTQRRKPVITTCQGAMLHPELRELLYEIVTQLRHRSFAQATVNRMMMNQQNQK